MGWKFCTTSVNESWPIFFGSKIGVLTRGGGVPAPCICCFFFLWEKCIHPGLGRKQSWKIGYPPGNSHIPPWEVQKIIFKSDFWWDMLVPWRVVVIQKPTLGKGKRKKGIPTSSLNWNTFKKVFDASNESDGTHEPLKNNMTSRHTHVKRKGIFKW